MSNINSLSLLAEVLASVAACGDADTLLTVGTSFNISTSPFSALCDVDKATVRNAYRVARTALNAISERTTAIELDGPTVAPTVAPTVDVVDLETTLVDIVRTSAAVGTRNGRATSTRVANQVAAIVADGSLLRASVATVGDGAELRHGNAEINYLTQRGSLVSALKAASLEQFAPSAPSAERHLGESMTRLNNNGLIARRADVDPVGVVSRWFVGRVDLDCTSDSLGDRDLVVDLVGTDLVFSRDGKSIDSLDGASGDLVILVRDAYQRRIDGETYNTTTMLAWLRSALVKSFGARDLYDTVYVPSALVDGARALVECAAPFMGRMVGLDTKASDAGLRRGLLVGFVASVDTIEREISAGKRGAESLLTELFKAQTAVEAFSVLLGSEYTDGLKDRIKALHATAAQGLSSTQAMASAIEMD